MKGGLKMKDKKSFEELNLQFKKLVNKAKEKKLIKSHVEAFHDVPVNQEKHKGNKKYFFN